MTIFSQTPVVEFTTYRSEHYAAFKQLMQTCYADMGGACCTEAEIALLSELYPQGQILAFVEGVLVGAFTSRIVPFAVYSQSHTQAEIEDMNRYRADKAKGDSVYGLDVFVHPDYKHLYLGKKLNAKLMEQIVADGFEFYIGVSRLSAFHKYADLDLATYVQKVIDREIKDPALTFHLLNGAKFLDLAPNFNPNDEPSLGCGVVVEIKLPTILQAAA